MFISSLFLILLVYIAICEYRAMNRTRAELDGLKKAYAREQKKNKYMTKKAEELRELYHAQALKTMSEYNQPRTSEQQAQHDILSPMCQPIFELYFPPVLVE